MKTVLNFQVYQYTLMNNSEVWTDLLFKVFTSPLFFLFIVILFYSLLKKEKRESVNNEIIKLIRAIKGNGQNNSL